MRAAALALGLVACGGPNEETLIEELRVVAAVADPPQVGLGQPYELAATIADPLGEGGDWAMWTCVPEVVELPPGVEDLQLPPLEPGCQVVGGSLEEETVSATFVGLPFPVYVMACNPGLCDLPGATEAQLQDPDAWMQELPMSGVALGRRFPRLLEAGEEAGANPVVVEVDGLEEEVAAEAELTLSFLVPGAETAFGYTTAGGFARRSYDVGSVGNTELVWVAPAEAGPARLYVVFVDELGGTAVWTADLTVR